MERGLGAVLLGLVAAGAAYYLLKAPRQTMLLSGAREWNRAVEPPQYSEQSQLVYTLHYPSRFGGGTPELAPGANPDEVSV